MNIIDISWPISSNMTQYKNKDAVHIAQSKTIEKNRVRETIISIDTHTGTHVDLPAHFMDTGKNSNDFDLFQCCGPCTVLDMTHVAHYITEGHLRNSPLEKNSVILFKTKNSFLNDTELFNADFVYLEKSCAAYLAQQQIKAVGIDYLGIEHSQPDHPTHTMLFDNDIAIIEGLRLRHVYPGTYTIFCLPLAFVGVEALPARAILIKNS